MENASKALIIAGSVLIAIIIIGALILMFNSLSNYQDTKVQNTREAQVLEFNNQYETYIRKDVRGSDLYSLLSRVVDYNRRKSEVATGTDEGQNLKYQPMTVNLSFGDNDAYLEKFTYDNTKRLFNNILLGNNNEFKLDKTTSNNFYQKINSKIENIEKNYGGSSGINNLVAGISNLFLKGNPSDDDKQKAERLYTRCTGNYNITFKDLQDSIGEDEGIYADICTYYEYVQFKRAHFDCIESETKYNSETGRIIELNFKFNGKVE